MKRITFLIAISLSFLTGFSQVQDVRAKRVIADQGVFIGTSGTYGRWIDTVHNDTSNLDGRVRTVMTANAVYDFVVGRTVSKSDTAAMLSVYVRRTELQDTAAAIREDFPTGGVPDGDKGNITVSGTGLVWNIDNDVVTYAKMQNVSATNRIMGRITTGSGNMEELTSTQATSLLDVFTTSLKGLVPASGGGTTNFMRADGTWAEPPGGGGGGVDNTASNLGGGLANYSTKVGIDLRFNSFDADDFDLGSNLISIDYVNGQKATASQHGFMTSAYAAKLDTNHYITNVGGFYEWMFALNDTVTAARTLHIISGATAVQTDSTIELTITGGGSGRLGYPGEDDEFAEPRVVVLGGYSLYLDGMSGGSPGGSFGVSTSTNPGSDSTSFEVSDQHIYLRYQDVFNLGNNIIEVGSSGIIFSSVLGSYIFANTKTPSSASDTGTTGNFAWDGSFIYICTATNTWKRVAIATW